MIEYKISGTSNLLESNRCWDTLKSECGLRFEDYGNVTNSLFSNDCSGLIVVLLLEDLTQNINDDFVSLQQSQITFLSLVKNKAKKSSKPIILCIGSGQGQNVIQDAKGDTDQKKFHIWLIQELTYLRDNFESIYLINLNNTFYQYGARKMFSKRNWYFGRCRFSMEGLQVLSDNLLAVIKRTLVPAKKVLVLDCDNTIWGGVIGEEGLAGLTLGQDGVGQAFADFQKEIVRLSNKGVIVVLASKNNEEDVWNVFDNHDSMVLTREHIVEAQINWNEKAHNLVNLANGLDLSAESFVFWDDNPLERDKMKTLMPQVYTVDVPESVLEWPSVIRDLDSLAKFKVTSEDKKKTAQYKSRAQFNKNVSKDVDLNSYLSSLNLSPSLLSLSASNISRAEQMCLKTNQFNLRTKRHSASDLLALEKNQDSKIFLVRLIDNYGDHGIVALVCLHYLTEGIVFLDTFLMSCRVLGRHLEAWLLDQIIQDAVSKEKEFIIADFIDSGRNKIAKDFLKNYRFEQLSADETVLASVRAANAQLEGCGYFLRINGAKTPNIEIFKREK